MHLSYKEYFTSFALDNRVRVMQTAKYFLHRLPHISNKPAVIAVFCIVLFVMTCAASDTSSQTGPFYTDLRASTWFVRNGFDRTVVFDEPDIFSDDKAADWVRVTPNITKKALYLKNIGLPYMPKRIFLSPFREQEQEFTVVLPFSVNAAMIASLMDEPPSIPGIFLTSIGDNWEIFLNGNLVRSEVHLDDAGHIRSHRSYRGVAFPLLREMFHEGTNYLVFRIIGAPSYDYTGFFYNSAYYLDTYELIDKHENETLILAICGIYIFIGMYQALTFLMLKKEQEAYNLYYSLFSTIAGLYNIMRTAWIHNFIIDSLIILRIEYALIFMMFPMLLCFLESLSYQKISKPTKVYLILSAILSIAQASFSPLFAVDILSIWQFMAMTEVCYLVIHDVWKPFKQELEKHKTVKNVLLETALGNLLLGLFFLSSLAVVDMFDSAFMQRNLLLSRYGLFIFIVSMFFILAKRYRDLYETLDRFAATLAETVRERTEQTRIAEEASTSKTRFIATLTHEIRTPLNIIKGMAEIELQNSLPNETLSHLEKVRSSAMALARLVDDTLDMARIETGKFELTPAEYDLTRLINDLVQLHTIQPEDKPVMFHVSIDETLPRRLYGDDIRLKQVLNNILSNAFKYTRVGTVILELRGEARVDGILLHIIISDTGIGIKKDDIGKLFSEYSRFDADTNRLVEGTGLGLAISKKLMNLMGGVIEVVSEYGKGTRFMLSIPQNFVDSEPIGKELARELEALRFAERPRRKRQIREMPNGRVLVVDDVMVNLDMIKSMLIPYKLSVDCVTNGREAVALIDEANVYYDLVFMDQMMPDMDGMEAVRIIREEVESEYARNVPIIAFTADALAGDGKRFLDAGFDGFIPKPIDVARLDEALNTWIPPEHSPAASDGTPPSVLQQDKQISLLDFSVEGIDIAAGIRHYESEAIYLEVLKSYARHTPELLEELRQIEENSGELAEYAVKVHGLKGSTLGICAEEAGGAAAALEIAARQGDRQTVQEGHAPLLVLFAGLLERLHAFLEGLESDKQQKEHRSEPDKRALVRLLEAGKEFDITAMEGVMEELEVYEYEQGTELVTWLREQVSNLEYIAITERLEGLDLK
jgi:signal transduction histidine kinase/CheY-like chemotaxis protein